jgi:hypothetical protein
VVVVVLVEPVREKLSSVTFARLDRRLAVIFLIHRHPVRTREAPTTAAK